MTRKDFLLKEINKAQSFELTEHEIDVYFDKIFSYVDSHSKVEWKTENKQTLSERQECCSKNAIKYLFQGNQVQALHETMDVLSDYNKDDELTYNEAILIKNIIEVRNQLKKLNTLEKNLQTGNEEKSNIIWCEVVCGKCGALAEKSGYYSQKLIKRLKEDTKDWKEDKEYGVLCPECRKVLRR